MISVRRWLFQERLHDARLSFVSGHASLSVYSMTYTVLYLQRGMGSKDFRLVKPLIQVQLSKFEELLSI